MSINSFTKPPPIELFVDESCRSDYLLCAAVVPIAGMAEARRLMRELRPHNRSRLHMKAEGRHREQIIAKFLRDPPIAAAHIFAAPLKGTGRPQREVRTETLQALANFAAANDVRRIMVESCNQDAPDKSALVGALAKENAHDRVRVEIRGATSHELLWAADLVAWAYGKGGHIRDAIMPFVTVHDLSQR